MQNLALSQKLLDRAVDMSAGEREALKTVLCLAAQVLPADGRYPEDPRRQQALRNVISCLSRLQDQRADIPPNGVVFRGRPPFMTDELLARLVAEAHEVKRTNPMPQIGHTLGKGGPIANALAVSPEMTAFVEAHTQPLRATGVASYLFYDQPEQGMKAHVDTGIFSINANIMLEHVAQQEKKSYLFIYPTSGPAERIVFAPGEMVLSYAGSIVHGRAPLGTGERVHNLTIGFQPL